jgi:integrase
VRPLKSRKSFVLYKKSTKSGLIWYAKFWNEEANKFVLTRSTGILAEGKKQRRYEAEQEARAMLPSITLEQKDSERTFIEYILDFWTPDSRYAKECAAARGKPLSNGYINHHYDDIRLHVETFEGFKGLVLRDLTPALIRDWRTWAVEKGLKSGRINKVMQAMTVPVHYAKSRGEIEKDPFEGIKSAPEAVKEKGILTSEEVIAVINLPAFYPQGRLGVLLGAMCGLRLGEVRGIKWGDIGNGVIKIQNNFIDTDGLKEPKSESQGTVPIPSAVQRMIDEVRKTAIKTGPDDYVMESAQCPGKPLGKTYFETSFARDLEAIGIPGRWRSRKAKPEGYINEQAKRNLTFHGLRHTFVTLGRLAGISDLEIQALARHKSRRMMERYSHANQVLDFTDARNKLEKITNKENKKTKH